MAGREVSMVCRRFVVSSLVMLGRFFVMTRRIGKVFWSFFVVSCSLLRHEIFLRWTMVPQTWSFNAGDRRGVPMEEDGPGSPIPFLVARPPQEDLRGWGPGPLGWWPGEEPGRHEARSTFASAGARRNPKEAIAA
jgi:hypothetical protein